MTKMSRWAPAIAWMALIFVLSAQSQLPTPEQRWVDFLLEKSAHFFEFAVLAFLLLRTVGPAQLGCRRAFAAALLIASLYALTDEFHQSYVPGRDADWLDVVFDWAGAFVGASVGLYWWTARNKRALSERV